MTAAPPRTSTSPRWDNLNEGFISPARLQQWKQEHERVHSFGSSLSQTPITSPQPDPAAANRPAPERRNTSTELSQNANGTPTKHRSRPSFTAFFTRKSSSDTTTLASPSANPRSATANPPMQSQQDTSQPAAPPRGPIDGEMNALQHSRLVKQHPPLPPQSQQPPEATPEMNTAAAAQPQPQPQPAQLHPEIRSVVQLTLAHAHKVYFSGPLIRHIERQPDGQKPAKDDGWREVWAQLGGTTLSVWDMAEIQEASKQGKQVPPAYINVTDAFVHVLGSIALPPTPGTPPRRYTNVLTLNTAGSNLYFFSCPSAEALVQWTAAMRLAAWEKSRLEEIYTAHLVRITLNDGRTAPTPLMNGRLEGWVRIRIAGQTDWKRQWMVISAGNPLGHPDQGSISEQGHERPESPNTPRKKRISNLFSRDRNLGAPLPARPIIQIFVSNRPRDRKKALLTIRTVSQAFAVYPERPELISRSTLMKLEGQLGDEEMAGVLKMREAWLLVMPELEGTNTRASEMLRWIIGIHDAFELYGRPRMYSWDPRDAQSMMFAYPIGPHRDLLFLDREFAETLDPRDDRTSAIRSQLQRVLLDRMNGVGPPGPSSPPRVVQQPPTLPPLPDLSDPREEAPSQPPQPQLQQQPNHSPPSGQQPSSDGPLSLELPPFNFDSDIHDADERRPLSPITERSSPLEGRSLSGEKPSAARAPSTSATAPPRIPEGSPSILQRPFVSSPTATSPPPDQTMIGRASTEAHGSGSRPDSKFSQPPGQISRSSTAGSPRSPTPPSATSRRQMSPEPRPVTPSAPPRFAAATTRALTPPRATSPFRATSPPQSQTTSPLATPSGPPLSSSRMVPDRSLSQASIPSIPTPMSRASYTTEPAPIAQPPVQGTAATHDKKPSLTDDILGDAGAALFYMQHMQQEGAVPPRKRGPPPVPAHDDDDEEEETPSDSESEPYTPPPRQIMSPLRVQQANSPPPHPSSPEPPIVPAKSPKPQTTAGQATPMATETPDVSRPGSGLRNRPSGARAAPSTRVSAYLQNSFPADTIIAGSASTTTAAVIATNKPTVDNAMAAAVHDSTSYEDHNADALAALSFLEQEDRPAPSPMSRSPPAGSSAGAPYSASPPLPEVIETPASPSQTRAVPSAISEQPRSSFAPTRLAAERKAKTQAQQAAQQAAAHRPGKANGRGRANPKSANAWGDSSEEEEEEEEEEDDDEVDSDAEPPARSAASVSEQHSASAHTPRSPYSQMAPGSPARGSGSAVDVNAGAYPPPRRPRDLPQVPYGQNPDDYLGASQSRRVISDAYTDGGRRNLYPGESNSRGASPQFGQPGPQGMRPQSQFPAQNQFAPQPQGPQRQIWSQVLDPDRSADQSNNGRDTFIQMEAPATTMTKAFTPHGLLSAGMQDKQDRSAKRQEELARETGASLINVPNKPPPPQTGLLGAVTAHERERKREGGIGAALTERERDKRLVEERQRKLDEFQRQQLDQMQQGGSMYGGMMPGFNPMMANPMMMGMNPMMTGGWGYPGMMPGFANPQQLFAAQQAAAQAYQQAMVAFSTAGSQIGGGDGQSPGQMNPMMTGGSMGMGGFDPRMSMMGMPMMNSGMGMNPMGMTPTGMSGMGGMGNMGMNPGMMTGGGMGMQMTGGSQFDPRFSPGLEGGAGQRPQGDPTPSGSRPFSSHTSSPAPGAQGPMANSSDGSQNPSGPPSTSQ